MIAARIAVAFGLGAIAFGYWGLYTKAGQHEYDEMAGIVPFAALAAGMACVVIGALVIVFFKYRRRS